MTRNGPKIVTLKYGSNFIASDVKYGLEYFHHRHFFTRNLNANFISTALISRGYQGQNLACIVFCPEHTVNSPD